jgi:hypothetical protein
MVSISQKVFFFFFQGRGAHLSQQKNDQRSFAQKDLRVHTTALHQDIFIWWNLVLWIMSALRVLQNLPHSRQWNPPVDKCLAST